MFGGIEAGLLREPLPAPAGFRGGSAPASWDRHARTARAEPSSPPSLHTEILALKDATGIVAAWEALAARALESNVFAEPAFAIGARQLPGGERTSVVLIWDGPAGQTRRLVGLFPVLLPRRRLGSIRGWRPIHSGLGTPLVDRDCPDAVVEAYLGAIAERSRFAAATVFPMVAEDGPFAVALRRVASRTGRTLRRFDAYERAALRRPAAEGDLGSAPSSKKLKELRRQCRRLGDLGEIRFESDRDPRSVRRAVEVFLALEASGWKGKSGTALLQDEGVAALVRTLTRDLARQGRCRVDTLWAADSPVASAIMIESGNRAWFWKIAYDEAFARYSPGVQITLNLTQAQLDHPAVEMTDSGAIANHPMIDRLWRDRIPIADLFVSTRPGPRFAAEAAGMAEDVRRRLRAVAKSTYRSFIKGKTS